MRRKTNRGILKYTAFVPKTMKATKNVGKKVVSGLNYFLNKSTKTLKNTTKMIDRRAAKTIRSMTKRRLRK